MQRNTSTEPRRVGYTNILEPISEPGVIVAATTKKAAEEGSPEIASSTGSAHRRAADGRAVDLDGCCGRGEHRFGVIAGLGRQTTSVVPPTRPARR